MKRVVETLTETLLWFQGDVAELNRRLMNIDSQLRRSELSRKHLEISNRKLLGFAQARIMFMKHVNA